ncbi:outer membrane beta-barrel protein [Proteiniphilum sp. UBA5384]|mgnify:FL=1|uniref:outer membrane beta-barrel protein n=1 Tax=Proteiniphilum sp. UBA5384 TaxID=1947279 RepID=UPI0025F19409|nr:outer membrane beta-barrel protein [Proteiniphilum sp. UBA5384]
MKRIFILAFFSSLLFIQKIQAQFEGTFGLGVHAGYGAEINNLGGGIHLHFYRTNNFRFAPSFTYFLENKKENMWMTDLDAHYILPVSYSASLYPIAGLHYSHWKYDTSKRDVQTEENWTKNRLGANLGLGFQHDIGYRIRANFELKYQFIKDFSQVFFSAGIGFWF